MADPIPSLQLHQQHIQKGGGYSAKVTYVDTPEGDGFELEICETCHYILTKCEHKRMVWEDDQHLICQACGIDGT